MFILRKRKDKSMTDVIMDLTGIITCAFCGCPASAAALRKQDQKKVPFCKICINANPKFPQNFPPVLNWIEKIVPLREQDPLRVNQFGLPGT